MEMIIYFSVGTILFAAGFLGGFWLNAYLMERSIRKDDRCKNWMNHFDK